LRCRGTTRRPTCPDLNSYVTASVKETAGDVFPGSTAAACEIASTTTAATDGEIGDRHSCRNV